MAKKKDIFEEEDNIFEKVEEQEKIEEKTWKKPYVEKKQKGEVRLVTATKVIIVYGDGLGTSIPFVPEKHFELKQEDIIEF
jgi:hypothetical protein